MTVLLLIGCFLLSQLRLTLAQVSGSIAISNSTVQQKDVAYTFQLQLKTLISPSGKATIRFPAEYKSSFSPSCKPISGFQGSALSCAYSLTTRLLTITGSAFPNTKETISLQVNGVTNPAAVTTTDFFFVAIYQASGDGFVLVESGTAGMQITTTAGLMYQKSLSLSNPTVGVLSVLTVQFFSPHNIPADGQIQLTLPKWNQFDPDKFAQVSMLAVSVSPGFVECAPQLGLVSLLTKCYFQPGDTSDLLTVQLNEAGAVAAGRQISVLVQGVRAPPSQQVVSGFTLKTTTSDGDTIDECFNQSTITLLATNPVQGSPTQVKITADNTTIQAVSTLTITYKNLNPLRAGATLVITIPTDFEIGSRELQYSVWGYSVNQFSFTNIDVVKRTITIQRFNDQYMPSFSATHFNISGVINPSSTNKTSDFRFQVTDYNFKPVEFINSGVNFQATANGFASVSCEVDNLNINMQNVNYTFLFQPLNSFQAQAKLKLLFPTQLFVKNDAFLEGVSSNMNKEAKLQIDFGSEVTLYDAFPSGYSQGDLIQFTISGVQNPSNLNETDPIRVKIFYTEFQSEINEYSGTNMTIKPTAAPVLKMNVSLIDSQTGHTDSQLIIQGIIPREFTIETGSIIQVQIPFQFKIPDLQRSQLDCLGLEGFFDDIECFLQKNDDDYYLLNVVNGFCTGVFNGGSFKIQLGGLTNPATTQITDKFDLKVFDRQSRDYYYIDQSQPPVALKMEPSDFLNANVVLLNKTNGAISDYQFWLTLKVPTQVGIYASVVLPAEIQLDSSQNLRCLGFSQLTDVLNCTQSGNQTVNFQLTQKDEKITTFEKGTTLGFQIGSFINPVSFARSSSYQITVYGYEAQQMYLVSQQLNDIYSQTQQYSEITVIRTFQSGSSQLGKTTELSFDLQTQFLVPSGTFMSISMPVDSQINGKYSIKIGQDEVTQFNISSDNLTVVFVVRQSLDKTFTVSITDGISNPSMGPYLYSGFNFQLKDSLNNPIAQTFQASSPILIDCGNNCLTCGPSLATCLTCDRNSQPNGSFFLLGSECVSSCPSGMFSNGTNQCQPCSEQCQECELSAAMCTQCDKNSKTPLIDVVSMQCVSICPVGTYEDTKTQSCQKCKAPCLTCSSAEVCNSCQVNTEQTKVFFLLKEKQQCVQSCEKGQLASPSNVCVDCELPCKSCSDQPESCLSCEAGKYLFGDDCVSACPSRYYQDNTVMKCKKIVPVAVPFPFSISTAVVSIGILISCLLTKDTNSQYKNAFIITTLAVVSIILRLNWLILGIFAAVQYKFVIFIWCIVLLAINIILNLGLWRRYFKFKYDIERSDQEFIIYVQKYPKTSKTILVLSYAVSFQAIRMVYSNLASMQMFSGSIKQKRTFYIILTRISLLEILVLFIPALAMNIYGICSLQPSDQIYYIVIDSLVLIGVTITLIVVALVQQEKMLSPTKIATFRELLQMNLKLQEESLNEDKQKLKVGSMVEESEDNSYQATLDDERNQIEVQSAADLNEIQARKLYLYQPELRDYDTDNLVFNLDPEQEVQQKYNLLAGKLDKIQLKKGIFEGKRQNDYEQVQLLSENLNVELHASDSLQLKLDQLKFKLQQLQATIELTTKLKEQEIKAIEERKRDKISKRNSVSQTSQNTRAVNTNQASSQKRQMSEGPIFAMSELAPIVLGSNSKQMKTKSDGRKPGKKRKGKKILAPESPADKFTIEEIYQFQPSAVRKSNASNPFV